MIATHILLLTRNQYPEDFSPFFSNHDLNAIVIGIETKHGIKKLQMSIKTFTSMIGIAEDLTMGLISRDKVIAHLLDLDLPTNEKRFKNCTIDLIRKLPPVSIAEDTNELELSTRYVDPFLFGLFDNLDDGMYMRWTNEITLEARQHEDLSTKRLDMCISRLHGMTWASNHGYGEVKSFTQGSNDYSVC